MNNESEIHELQFGDGPWREVSQSEYLAAERAAGFRPKPGCGPYVTGSFSHGEMRGRHRTATEA